MQAQRKNRQVLIGLLVVVTAVIAMVKFGLSNSKIYSLQPTELVNKGQEFYGRDLRLIGVVVDGSIRNDIAQTKLDFVVCDNHNDAENPASESSHPAITVPVTYIGTVIPDAFKDGSEVVVEGTFDGETFRATHIMTKCPSKYDAEPEKYADRKVA